MSDSKTPYENQGNSNDTPSRQKLVALRVALLKIHKSLLELERREYEKTHGKVSAGELFRLVIDNAQFAWLHNISEFVVRIDELLAGETPVTDADSASSIALARKMFTPAEDGDAFQKKYFAAIQNDAEVVMEHAQLARIFQNEPSDNAPSK